MFYTWCHAGFCVWNAKIYHVTNDLHDMGTCKFTQDMSAMTQFPHVATYVCLHNSGEQYYCRPFNAKIHQNMWGGLIQSWEEI